MNLGTSTFHDLSSIIFSCGLHDGFMLINSEYDNFNVVNILAID